MKIRKYIGLGILSVSCLMNLSGCKTKYSSIPSETEVMEEVKKACSSETFSLVSKEKTGSEPDEMTYSFKTDGRGLEFQAVATLGNRLDLGEENPYAYQESITNNYYGAVSDLYEEDILNIFRQFDYFDEENAELDITDNSHNEEIADAVCQAQEIYSAELEYNTEAWMDEHPAYCIYISLYKDEEFVDYYDVNINGVSDRNAVIDGIEELLAAK